MGMEIGEEEGDGGEGRFGASFAVITFWGIRYTETNIERDRLMTYLRTLSIV